MANEKKTRKGLVRKKTVVSTQQYLDILQIRDDVVILKNGTVLAVLLVSSSFTYYAAEAAHKEGRNDGLRAWLGVSMALGAAFVGLSAYEWSDLMGQGFGIGTNVFSTSFYSITGFHASHVAVGLGVFLAILLPALGGRTSAGLIKAGGIYWHFVDIVWLFVVSQVYFL